MEPMRGIRIIEVTTNASGPMATQLLADQGADVIRLEPIGAGRSSAYKIRWPQNILANPDLDS